MHERSIILLAERLAQRHDLGPIKFLISDRSLTFLTPGIPFGFLYDFTKHLALPFSSIITDPEIKCEMYGTLTGHGESWVESYRWAIPLGVNLS